ncbi:MAG: ATP-binding protein [Sphaerochaeta sp.]|jgi:AAA+ ATPase superfamily predicted ATPase
MFVGREAEREQLHRAWTSDRFELAVLWGRRRVGKTMLVNEFCRGKKAIQITAYLTGVTGSLEHLSRQVSEVLFPRSPITFGSLEELLSVVGEHARGERIILSIDEFPYLAQSIPETMSILQMMVDRLFKDTKLMIILTGSSMGFMERQVLGHESPLYGRRTVQIHLLPFMLTETAKLLPNRSIEEVISVHSLTGGIPQYIQYFTPRESLDALIEQLFFTKDGLLFNEPNLLLMMEVRDTRTYNQILEVLAAGNNQISVIADKTHISTATVSASMANLQELGIVINRYPVGRKARRAIWEFSDQLFAFWYRFVFPYTSLILSGKTAGVLARTEKYLPQFLGRSFEAIAQEYVLNTTELLITEIGRWWGPDPTTKGEEEIDLVAHDGEGNYIFGECKWTNSPASEATLNTLIHRSTLVTKSANTAFWLFSKSGFTDSLKAIAKQDGRVRLVGLEDLFSQLKR